MLCSQTGILFWLVAACQMFLLPGAPRTGTQRDAPADGFILWPLSVNDEVRHFSSFFPAEQGLMHFLSSSSCRPAQGRNSPPPPGSCRVGGCTQVTAASPRRAQLDVWFSQFHRRAASADSVGGGPLLTFHLRAEADRGMPVIADSLLWWNLKVAHFWDFSNACGYNGKSCRWGFFFCERCIGLKVQLTLLQRENCLGGFILRFIASDEHTGLDMHT